MARFVIANRRAGKFHEPEKRAARAALDRAAAALPQSVDVLADNDPPDDTARRVMIVEAEPAAVASVSTDPDVIIEPEILHWPELHRPADFITANRSMLAGPVAPGQGIVDVQVSGSGAPLLGAEVLLFLRGPGHLERELRQVTGADGRALFSFSLLFAASALVVVPAGNFWPVIVRGPAGVVSVDCPPLPMAGPVGWWQHQVLGENVFDPNAGAGIRIGVVDTGVGPHTCLNHVVDIGAFIDGAVQPPPSGQDVDSHGTHVCGTIGARPTVPGQYAGIAPGANLFSARVFPPGQGANQGDIANAIDELSRTHNVDLINLSLGAPQPSEIEHDAILDALERGTLCVCAAANSNGPVEFPAAFEECIAVSALGLLGTAPPGTLSAGRLPIDRTRFGDSNLYLANFSCFGAAIDCAGPGVAVIATVPERFGLVAPYGAMDGTSMASPAVCAALAVRLAASADYQGLPRDVSRGALARAILRQACRDVGLSPDLQGRGVPTV